MTVEEMFKGVSSGTPQCEILSAEDATQCPRGSYVRIITFCEGCDRGARAFVCHPHYLGIGEGMVTCFYCKAPNMKVRVI